MKKSLKGILQAHGDDTLKGWIRGLSILPRLTLDEERWLDRLKGELERRRNKRRGEVGV
ncbi:hypothetical protein [Luteolibacter marinus]|uniref:hypothetical protein n=1 Tax=Luteolibacter marinus TaxID=2776705 RepID=UPI001868ECDC|nr:hypothetical protein [Luteolibacter marinus]